MESRRRSWSSLFRSTENEPNRDKYFSDNTLRPVSILGPQTTRPTARLTSASENVAENRPSLKPSTSTKTNSDASSSEDEESDTETLKGVSSVTLNMADNLDDSSPAGRLAKMFENDLEELVSSLVSMEDGESKLLLIRQTQRSLRNLRTSVNINSHLIILSSLCCPPPLDN